jgi:protein associated with RNAse G/E
MTDAVQTAGVPFPADGSSHARPLVIQKLLYDGSKSYRWVGREIQRDEDHLFFTAVFERDGRDLGYVRFDKGDVFYEWYYFDRWYNVFQVYSASGDLKGWYCNITAPAKVDGDELTFVDLALDLWVWSWTRMSSRSWRKRSTAARMRWLPASP